MCSTRTTYLCYKKVMLEKPERYRSLCHVLLKSADIRDSFHPYTLNKYLITQSFIIEMIRYFYLLKMFLSIHYKAWIKQWCQWVLNTKPNSLGHSIACFFRVSERWTPGHLNNGSCWGNHMLVFLGFLNWHRGPPSFGGCHERTR